MTIRNIKLLLASCFVCCNVIATLTACSPEEFEGANPQNVPTVGDTDFQMNVDQETNQMVATFTPAAGTYPIWIIDGTSYSTLSEVGYTNTEAGTHTVELRLGNRNGISQTGVKKTFTFNETKIDWSADFRRITGKEWRINSREVGHMGCGPAGTDATGWWSAAVGDKKDFGVYDDRITFTAETRKGGAYTYNAGDDGLTYVNKECTAWGSQNDAADVDVTIGNQTSTWNFEVADWTAEDGTVTTGCKYIRLAANTAFPYISSDAQYQDPLFRVEQLTATKMVVYYEKPDRSIAWRFVFTSEADQRLVEESGFDANSDFNLWKGITPTMSFYYNPDPSWGNDQTALMESLFKMDNNDYTVSIPQQCFAEWQAQVHFHTALTTSAATNYDFSCILTADRDIDGVVVKLTNETDADAIIDEHGISLKAGQPYVFWKSDVPGKDLDPVKLVFDFGFASGETNINISNIVLKDHANDDGTIVPGQQGGEEPGVTWVAVDSPDNLAAGFNTKGEMNFWWSDPSWSQIGNPEFSYADGVYTIKAVDATVSEWQAQNSIQNVAINIEEGQAYDLRVKLVANQELGRFTLKLCEQSDDDNTLVYRGDLKLADGENIIELTNLVAAYSGNKADKANKGSFTEGKFFIDLGGCPAGFELQISELIVQKHTAPAVDESDPALIDWAAADAAENLGAAFNTKGQMNFWWSDPSWSQIGNPEFSFANGVYTIKAVDATVSEWQAQNSIQEVDLNIEAGQAYDISVRLESNQELGRYTLKLCEQDDDDNTLLYRGDLKMEDGENLVQFANLVAAYGGNKADKANPGAFTKAKFFIDLGGCPAGFEVKVSQIIVQKHKLK
ncbi:MAG: hypothetical protein IKG77_08320 [Prevotella sp.]|nr:hypothetical protein [Prevotella sp.]